MRVAFEAFKRLLGLLSPTGRELHVVPVVCFDPQLCLGMQSICDVPRRMTREREGDNRQVYNTSSFCLLPRTLHNLLGGGAPRGAGTQPTKEVGRNLGSVCVRVSCAAGYAFFT